MLWFLVLALRGMFAPVECSTKRSIIQNGQVKVTAYPNTAIDTSAYTLNSYPANASELSYKGRWDSNKVSWWS